MSGLENWRKSWRKYRVKWTYLGEDGRIHGTRVMDVDAPSHGHALNQCLWPWMQKTGLEPLNCSVGPSPVEAQTKEGA